MFVYKKNNVGIELFHMLKLSFIPSNRPLPSSENPRFQNETKCSTFVVKMSFICMRMKMNFHIKG